MPRPARNNHATTATGPTGPTTGPTTTTTGSASTDSFPTPNASLLDLGSPSQPSSNNPLVANPTTGTYFGSPSSLQMHSGSSSTVTPASYAAETAGSRPHLQSNPSLLPLGSAAPGPAPMYPAAPTPPPPTAARRAVTTAAAMTSTASGDSTDGGGGLSRGSSSSLMMTGPGGSLSQLTATPASASQRNASTPGFCCSIEVSLDTIKQNHPAYGTGGGLAIEVPGAPSPAARPLLSVVDAVKAHDGSGSSYTAYLIRYGDRELKRRYSDFASLRKSLAKLYPTLLLPPIPEKHSLADYATKPTRAKQDPVTIDKRKRMLASFLNRLAWHPILAADHLVHRFLDPAALWADVLHAAKVASLPQKSSATGAGGTAAGPALVAVDGAGGGGGGASGIVGGLMATLGAAAGHVAGGGSSRPAATAVKRPDPKFVDAEAFTHKFETVIKDSVEKPHRRLARRYAEVCSDYAELSAAYNALSLSEAPAVAAALDKVGTAYDTMHASTARLSHGMEETIGERWHEYVQFAEVVKGVLRYRTELQLALEGTIDALESKRAALAQLERADADAQRLVDALRREGYASAGSSSPISGATSPLPPVPPGATAIGASGPASSAEYHLHESTTGRRSGLPPATGGTGIVAALSDKLSAMLDNDPEATRRSNLAKTRDVVALLEQQRERQANDVVQAAEAVAHDLDRFQRQKMHDVRAILLATARTHAEWARRNLRGWTDAREYVGAVPSDLE